MDVHVRDLRYFIAVAEELSFTKAANERLFVSQPALSKQIRQLETSLRVRLFDRDRRKVSLTPAGQALLLFATQIIERWDSAQQAVAATAAEQKAALRVGLQTSVGRGLLAAASAGFAARHPTWSLALRQVTWDDPTAGLADASCDVALLWLPLPDPSAYAWEVMATEARWVAMPAGHRLARRAIVPFAELLDESFLALPSSAGPLRDYWLAMGEREGHPVRVAAEVANTDETFEAIAAGIGVVLLSEVNAAIYQRQGVVSRPVSGLSPSQLVVAWRANDHRPIVRDFVQAAIATRTEPGGPPQLA